MPDERIPDVLDLVAREGVCPSTVNGWLWYCDVHDTHGNADSEPEAVAYVDAHVEFFAADDEEHDISIWQRTPHERLGPP